MLVSEIVTYNYIIKSNPISLLSGTWPIENNTQTHNHAHAPTHIRTHNETHTKSTDISTKKEEEKKKKKNMQIVQ